MLDRRNFNLYLCSIEEVGGRRGRQKFAPPGLQAAQLRPRGGGQKFSCRNFLYNIRG